MLDRTVCGIFIKSKEKYEAIGSGTFLFHDGQVYLVSAAHVFEQLQLRGKAPCLHVGSTKEIYQFYEAKFYLSSTSLVNGNRELDTLDIGIMILPDEFIDKLNGCFLIVTEDLIEDYDKLSNLQFYQAIGYPVTKNDKLAHKAFVKNTALDTYLLKYNGKRKLSSELKGSGFIDNYHIIMDFNPNKCIDDDGNKRRPTQVKGMSGGLIQGFLDYKSNSKDMYQTYAAGIITQKTKENDAIIGTKFSAVFEWLDLHKHQFSSSL